MPDSPAKAKGHQAMQSIAIPAVLIEMFPWYGFTDVSVSVLLSDPSPLLARLAIGYCLRNIGGKVLQRRVGQDREASDGPPIQIVEHPRQSDR